MPGSRAGADGGARARRLDRIRRSIAPASDARVATILSNDYWVGQRLTFESGETIRVVMVHPDGTLGFSRYAPYVTAGLADPRPAYLEIQQSSEAIELQQRFSSGSLTGYTESIFGSYLVLLPPR
jgi:hypothetical protein